MEDSSPVTETNNQESAVKRVEYAEWTEMPHPIWGEGGRETEALKKLGYLEDFPQTIWHKGKYSIIPPCKISFNQWELYDGTDVTRYTTLEEAQQNAKGDPSPLKE